MRWKRSSRNINELGIGSSIGKKSSRLSKRSRLLTLKSRDGRTKGRDLCSNH